MTKECYEMKAGRPELERRIKDLEDKNKKAASDLQARTEKYKKLKLDRDELSRRSDEQVQSITSIKIQIQSYEKRIEGLNEHLNQDNHSPEAAPTEDPSFEFNRLNGVIESLQEDKSELNTEIERLGKKIEKQSGKIKGMTEELAFAKHKFDDLDQMLHAMESDKDKEIEILVAYRSEDTMIITELNMKITNFDTQVTDLTNDLEFERNIIADLKLQKVKR
jgi:chromosome segregation ATPase